MFKTTNEKETVFNNIHMLRRQKGDTQEQLANAVGISRQTVSAIEKGNYTPSVLLALKLAKYFGLKVEEIFSYKGKSNEDS